MNKDNQDSLSLFLRYYCNVPSASATPTTLQTFNLDSMIITSQGKRYYIPLDPPLPSFASSRSKMKAMHEECLRGLDLSDVKITTFLWPQTLMSRVTFVAVLLTILSFSRRGNFVPGSFFFETVGLRYLPRFAWFCRSIQPWLITFILGIHLAEAVWMARTRLRRHGVRRWSVLWWKWVGICFIEGITSFQRLDEIIREKEEEKH
jgi:Protein of unknown function (DUF2470)